MRVPKGDATIPGRLAEANALADQMLPKVRACFRNFTKKENVTGSIEDTQSDYRRELITGQPGYSVLLTADLHFVLGRGTVVVSLAIRDELPVRSS